MKTSDVSEVLSVNPDHIDIILYPVHNSKVSRSSYAYETIQNKTALARKHQKFFNFTNKRDGIKSIMVLSSGIYVATSLTRDKINMILSNKRHTKVRTSR